MKKLYFILFLLFFLFASIFPQPYTWDRRVSTSSGLGNPIVVDKRNTNIVYYGNVNKLYKSYNRGETFSQYGSLLPNSLQVKNIILSSKDTLTLLVAIEGQNSLDKILKTTDGGQTWAIKLDSIVFSYFGIPMTPSPKSPDTIYTMSGNNFYRSTNFGDTWTVISTPTNFNAPCDIEVFPDSSNIILVGDNGTGIFRSSDGGFTWSAKFTTSGEIPTIAIDKRTPNVCYATRWGSGGGFLKSTDYGNTWTPFTFFSGKNMWGVDVAEDDPKLVMAGQYSGGIIYYTKNGGDTWNPTTIGGSNYAIYIVDSMTIFAAQSNGFYKLRSPYWPIPVELVSFEAVSLDNEIELRWVTATETNNREFRIEYSSDESSFSTIGSVKGNGTTSEKHNYSFRFVPSSTGKHFFRLCQIDFDGTENFSQVVEVNFAVENSFVLNQNFPNPFNPVTTINYILPVEGTATLSITNTTGALLEQISLNSVTSGTFNYTSVLKNSRV